MADLVPSPYGPCSAVAKTYLTVSTNEHGAIQVHPCGSCHATFLYSEAMSSWVRCVDPLLRDRLQADVNRAIDNRVPGFRAYHRIHLARG